MSIRILAVGKKHEAWIYDGIKRYEQRLQKPWSLEWTLLPHSSLGAERARDEESGRLLAHLKADEFVVLLDEKGAMFDSPTLARLLVTPLERSQAVTIIIGGAYGVNEALKTRANTVWALSPLVFPHQLVRLMLAEQLYRSQEITAGRPYHHQ